MRHATPFEPTGPIGLVVTAFAVVFGFHAAALAADGGTEQTRSPGEVSNVVQMLSERIESPFCPGKTLSMCPSGSAAEVRRDIQRMARRGDSPEKIEQAIIDKYGEEYRLEPPPERDNYALLGLVAAGFIACIGAVGWFVRRRDGDDGDAEDDEEWDERDEVYLEDLRDQYRD